MNTAEGSARLLRQLGPKGTMLPQTFFQCPSLWLSIHLLVLRAGTQLRPSETGGLISLSLWQQQCHPQFSFGAISTTILTCFSSVLKCPRHFCICTLTSKGSAEWHVRTWAQRGAERRANLCLSPTVRLHWYHENSGTACTDPWQHSGGMWIFNKMGK